MAATTLPTSATAQQAPPDRQELQAPRDNRDRQEPLEQRVRRDRREPRTSTAGLYTSTPVPNHARCTRHSARIAPPLPTRPLRSMAMGHACCPDSLTTPTSRSRMRARATWETTR